MKNNTEMRHTSKRHIRRHLRKTDQANVSDPTDISSKSSESAKESPTTSRSASLATYVQGLDSEIRTSGELCLATEDTQHRQALLCRIDVLLEERKAAVHAAKLLISCRRWTDGMLKTKWPAQRTSRAKQQAR
jgi:hypothetical protein